MKNVSQQFAEICPLGGTTFVIVVHFPSTEYVRNGIIFCIANSFVIIPTVVLNGISIPTISRSSQLKAKLCYFVILLQSAVDMAVGSISLPLYTSIGASEVLGTADCVNTFVSQTIAYLVSALSMATLYLLTFERYMSILHPVTHRSRLTKHRILIAFCCACTLVVLGPVLQTTAEEVYGITVIAVVLSILLFTTFAYTKIFLAVKNMHFSGRDGIGDCSIEQTPSDLNKKRALREKKLAKSCLLVVVISYLSYVPSLACYSYYKDDPVALKASLNWSMTVAALNASANSIIFFWKRPLLRGEALNVLKNLLHK
ncbi:cannabinoid receptor 1-like [Dendronephthya gigantea]|uniref:cannabinoid receptor 1-like n=1 Tax=Dendronephthya gigantea TaxID=151771 RepID=UPI00106B7961|nr:cannabinoid receptor 1-like [Dendronephthya gigantea]